LPDCSEQDRREIALLARRKEMRIVPRSPEMPCDWRPTQVNNPRVGLPFDDKSAWHFIADLAESGHPIEEMTLDRPAGERGHVMTIALEAGVPDLYVKIQLKRGRIFGRSFHYSVR
jgi:hypothetical protein